MRILAPVTIMLIALVASSCDEKTRPSVLPTPLVDVPTHESWNSTVRFSDSARVKAILWAGHIAAYGDRQFTLFRDSLRVDFFNELEYHTSTLTARRGRVNDQTHDLAAYDDVVVTSDSGTILKTDSLFWNNATRKVSTDAFVEISSRTEYITGYGLVSDQALKNYRISRVSGRALSRE